MPVFEYKATDASGKVVTGTAHGADLIAVTTNLQGKGLTVQSVQQHQGLGDIASQPAEEKKAAPPAADPAQAPADATTPSETPKDLPPLEARSIIAKDIVGPVVGKVPLRDLYFYFKQLATMLSAGVGMVQTMNTLSNQSRSPKLRGIIREMAGHVEAGRPMSAGMQRYPEVFSPLMMSMIRTGERLGTLDSSSDMLAAYLEQEMELRRLISRETMYPKIVIVASIIIIAATNSVIGMVGGGNKLWSPLTQLTTWYWLGPLLIGLFLFIRIGLQNNRIKFNWDVMIACIPGFASVARKFAMAKFGRAFGALYKGGVSIPEAITLGADACGNEYIRSRIYPAVRHLEAGKPITQTFKETGIFNPIVIDMTQTGEMTGSLDQMLLKVAEFYEGEAAVQARRNALIFGVVVFLCVAIYVLIVLINFYTGYFQNIFKAAESNS